MKKTKEELKQLYAEANDPSTQAPRLQNIWNSTPSVKVRKAILANSNVPFSLVKMASSCHLQEVGDNKGLELRTMFSQDTSRFGETAAVTGLVEALEVASKGLEQSPPADLEWVIVNLSQRTLQQKVAEFYLKTLLASPTIQVVDKLRKLFPIYENSTVFSKYIKSCKGIKSFLKKEKNALVNTFLPLIWDEYVVSLRPSGQSTSPKFFFQSRFLELLGRRNIDADVLNEVCLKLKELDNAQRGGVSTKNDFYGRASYSPSIFRDFSTSLEKEPAFHDFLAEVYAVRNLALPNHYQPVSFDRIGRMLKRGESEIVLKYFRKICQYPTGFLGGMEKLKLTYITSSYLRGDSAPFFIGKALGAIFAPGELKKVVENVDFNQQFINFKLSNKVHFTKALLIAEANRSNSGV